jgi:hypothetical protein
MPARKARSQAGARYSAHPALRMTEAYHRNLHERTGRTIDEWVALARRKGPADRKLRLAWLKEQGLTTNYAWWVLEGGETGEGWDPAKYVDDLYSGPKAHLRTVNERLVDLALALGPDVKACPCQTMIPLYRKFCFAEIRPATNDRVDLGLALGTEPAAGRLETMGARAAGNRITHRVRISSLASIDAEVKRWLKSAYERGDAPRQRSAPPAGKAKLPADFAKALAASAKAKGTWEDCTDRMRADWTEWIQGAAKADTRARRISQAIDRLSAGRKRAY